MLIGIDQVLLDVLVPIDDDPKILERHQIQPLSQCLAEEKHMPLVKEALASVEAGKASATPGGIIANSLRAGSWWLKRQKSSTAPRRVMLGRIGQDAAGKRLQKEISASQVEPMFDEARCAADNDAESTTGTCCCFLAEKARTMLTHLGASKTLHLRGTSECKSFDSRMNLLQASLAGVQPCVVLVSGFYAQADPEGVAAIRSWCSTHHTTKIGGHIIPALAMTVGAEWCTELEPVQATARAADFTFANEAEVLHLASTICKAARQSAPSDYDAAMLVIARWKERGWMIGTRGSRGVGYIGVADSQVRSLPVPPVPPEEFKDDVGAGDAFMGGFIESIWQALHVLAQEAGSPSPSAPEGRKRKLEDTPLVDDLKDADIQDAVRSGITAAAACIRCSGCQFPS